jgi:hypothetical protein
MEKTPQIMRMSSMDKNLQILLDEIAQAEAKLTVFPGVDYPRGYYDGLYMALEIIRGKHE